jgi:HK97 family phage major capsid protein
MMHRVHSRVPESVVALLAIGAPANGAVFAHADAVIQAHRDRQGQLLASSTDILAKAEAEKRDLSVEEQNEVAKLAAEFDRLDSEIELRERVVAMGTSLTTPRARQTDADPIPGNDPAPAEPARPAASAAPAARPALSSARAAAPRVTANGNGGFRGLGEFALAVRQAAHMQKGGGGEIDARLRNASATTYSSEGVGADGGFAVPPDFRSDIMAKVFAEDSLIARTDRMQSSSNTITFPIDMTTPWDTTGGIQSYWTAEAGAKTQSKAKLEEVTVKLSTLATLVPVTEELLEDAPAMDAYLRRKVPEKMDFKISDAMIRGSGAGMPLGILNAPCLVTQAAESAQTADTVVVANLAKMWGRLPIQSRRTAVWLMHPDVEAQLPLMTLANQPVYLPPGGVSGNMYGSLWGRPVIPHQVCETIGDLGDIMLTDWSQYLTATKTGNGRDANGMRSDVSIHLWFDQDLVAYRFTVRVAGQPWWSAATAQRDGSNTQSPFITLASR